MIGELFPVLVGSVKTLPLPVLACASLCLSAIADSKLNVMFITLDDMNRDSVGVYGSKVKGTTPNIDKLAGEAVVNHHAWRTYGLLTKPWIQQAIAATGLVLPD